MIQDLWKKMKHPDAEYRSCPFWSWNGEIQTDEVIRQAELFHEMGMGGFFIHGRSGLTTPYFSRTWFDCVNAAVETARKNRMNPWLYDENRYPSGFADGMATKDHRYRIRVLFLNRNHEFDSYLTEEDREIARFAAVTEGDSVKKYRRLHGPEDLPSDGEDLLAFHVWIGRDHEWLSDQAYLDMLNPKAVDRFIHCAYDRYEKETGQYFHTVIPGIFTDEPNFSCTMGLPGRSLPWTGALPEKFAKKYHYDLLEFLPDLFYHASGECGERRFSTHRYRFYSLIANLFENSAIRKIGGWCQKRGMIFTGHLLNEDTLTEQRDNAGAVMRSYVHMGMPGIDMLGEYQLRPFTVKQCSSVARQFGKKRVLSELYGCTGWDFPLLGHKTSGDWQYACGVNFRCPHLSFYAMGGNAKRDCPASLSYQTPWYREYRYVEDYFARLSAALTEDEAVRDLLVVHPIESAFGGFRGPDRKKPDPLDTAILDLTDRLLREHLDFDFGDELHLKKFGRIHKKTLYVNLAPYRAVLLPLMDTIRSSTLALLRKFVRAGGLVCYLGDAPVCVDGMASGVAAVRYRDFVKVTPDTLNGALSGLCRRVSALLPEGDEAPELLTCTRRAKDFETLFACNLSTPLSSTQDNGRCKLRRIVRNDIAFSWKTDGRACLMEYDLETGVLRAVRADYDTKQKRLRFHTSFDELQSRLFFAVREPVADLSAEGSGKTAAGPFLPMRENARLTVEMDEPNALVLDHPSQVEDGKESAPVFIRNLCVQNQLDLLKQRTDAKEMILLYRFRCGELPPRDCELAWEAPSGKYCLELNGHPLDPADRGYWCDKIIRKIAVPRKFLTTGGNILRITLHFDAYTPLETLYLLGDFSVRDDTLGAPVRTLGFGDWCGQGLPYYSGNLIYHIPLQNGEREFRPSEWDGAGLMFACGDGGFQPLLWAPWQRSIPAGTRELRIKVLGHRRNVMGPFFSRERYEKYVWGFDRYDTKERHLVPCGLLQPVCFR